jgi:hypothetical protein
MRLNDSGPRVAGGLGIVAALLLAAAAAMSAHGTEARYVELIQWKKEHFAHIFATGTSALGVPGSRNSIQLKIIDNKACVLGNVVAFDVDDAFAFDVDEPVTLTLTYAPQFTTPFVVGWDKSGGTGLGLSDTIDPEPGATFRSVTLTLDRARLAGQGTQGSDIAVGSRTGLALCDVQIARSGTTKKPTAFGQVRLTVKDAKTGGIVPARVGMYDETGRAPLASDRAIMLQRYADDVRMLAVNDRTFWPSPNRQAFYVNGNYEGRLPVGTYELVATRGPEYRAYHGSFEIRRMKPARSTSRWALRRSAELRLVLGRFAHPSDARHGCRSARLGYGRGRGRLRREPPGNGQHRWHAFQTTGEVGCGEPLRPRWSFHRLRSGGSEDGQLGHTIHHNLLRPIHLDSDTDFLYEFFAVAQTRRDLGFRPRRPGLQR